MVVSRLWVNFILGLNFLFFCFKLIIIHYHTPKQKKIKFKPTPWTTTYTRGASANSTSITVAAKHAHRSSAITVKHNEATEGKPNVFNVLLSEFKYATISSQRPRALKIASNCLNNLTTYDLLKVNDVQINVLALLKSLWSVFFFFFFLFLKVFKTVYL